MGRTKVIAGVVALGLLGGGAVIALWDSMPWADKRDCAGPSAVLRTDLAVPQDTTSFLHAMLSPDGRHLLWPVYEPALLDVTTGKTVRHYDGSAPEVMSFRADGSSFVALQQFENEAGRVPGAAVWPVDGDKAIQVFPGLQPLAEKKDDRGRIQDTAVSPDGKLVALSTTDGLVRTWNVRTGALETTMEEKSEFDGATGYQASRLAFSPDGKLVALGDAGGRVLVWNTGTGKVEHRFNSPGSGAIEVAFSPDGKYLAVREYGPEQPSSRHDVWVVEIATERTIQVTPQWSIVGAMRFSPDSSAIVTANQYGEIDRTTLADGKTTTVLDVCGADQLMVTPDTGAVLSLAKTADRAGYELRTFTLP
ncbi:WD40 repeat domain-containing protein [Actinoplanes sp. GCM10030250]|uniref:WD40 repeat domain-containing protein n=1 Tax=Actinoplanes sp. GCM10030250 TaxID=3273376 RepID=UPI003617A411